MLRFRRTKPKSAAESGEKKKVKIATQMGTAPVLPKSPAPKPQQQPPKQEKEKKPDKNAPIPSQVVISQNIDGEEVEITCPAIIITHPKPAIQIKSSDCVVKKIPTLKSEEDIAEDLPENQPEDSEQEEDGDI